MKNLKKFEEFLIESGGDFNILGEGASEKIIGYTKSGKTIYDNRKPWDHKDFTPEDHEDAERLHKELAKKGSFKRHINQGVDHYAHAVYLRSKNSKISENVLVEGKISQTL